MSLIFLHRRYTPGSSRLHDATFQKATRGIEPISYRGVQVSTLLHAIVYMFLHNLLNVLVQIANKKFQKKKLCNHSSDT
jgi:hypothetical protein